MEKDNPRKAEMLIRKQEIEAMELSEEMKTFLKKATGMSD